MAVNIIPKWEDDDFQKNRNPEGYIRARRLRIVQDDPTIGTCTWCGKHFLKKHHSEKYCSPDCRKDARSHQSRMKAHRWYHNHKHELTEKQRWGLGSGTLGSHMHEDFEKEQSVIEKEFTRLRIKRKR